VSNDELITSAARRFLKLGGLAGRVGASVVTNQALDLVRSGPTRKLRQTENLVKNALRIVETLGELKGAAMKVGQMLSLHEGLLPQEVSEVLRSLQKEAPRVPAEVMEFEIRGALDDYDELFESLDFEAFAAASIGQVHRGRMKDGRDVAVKIQYPLIEEIVKADLKNLKTLLKRLFALFSKADFEPIWAELRDGLMAELDYLHEAANIRRMIELHAGVPEIVIPRVVSEATTRNVLTMEFVGGIPPVEACSARYPDELRDQWGVALSEFQIRGIIEHRFVHADPNMANFAFLEDGRVVVYDFGCVKRVPGELACAYAEAFVAVIEGRVSDLPAIFAGIGLSMNDGSPVPVELVEPYIELISEVFRAEPPYTFGEDNRQIYDEIIRLGFEGWEAKTEMQFPQDVIFVNRSLSGHFGNLSRLRATGPWRDLVLEYATKYEDWWVQGQGSSAQSRDASSDESSEPGTESA
jgi:predicted unusual protein kinase regulating ubiquinone biosynthesis (AarF/ABC1/UbiB family)